MNLQEDICKRCKAKKMKGNAKYYYYWNTWDVARWKKKKVICTIVGFTDTTSIPKECPYALEHLIQQSI